VGLGNQSVDKKGLGHQKIAGAPLCMDSKEAAKCVDEIKEMLLAAILIKRIEDDQEETSIPRTSSRQRR
jgi:hypothetical protein